MRVEDIEIGKTYWVERPMSGRFHDVSGPCKVERNEESDLFWVSSMFGAMSKCAIYDVDGNIPAGGHFMVLAESFVAPMEDCEALMTINLVKLNLHQQLMACEKAKIALIQKLVGGNEADGGG